MATITWLSLVMALACVTILTVPEAEGFFISDCYETWSRCSTWSNWLTGILWKSCDDRCKRDLKKRGGRCVLAKSKCSTSGKSYQCQCY